MEWREEKRRIPLQALVNCMHCNNGEIPKADKTFLRHDRFGLPGRGVGLTGLFSPCRPHLIAQKTFRDNPLSRWRFRTLI